MHLGQAVTLGRSGARTAGKVTEGDAKGGRMAAPAITSDRAKIRRAWRPIPDADLAPVAPQTLFAAKAHTQARSSIGMPAGTRPKTMG